MTLSAIGRKKSIKTPHKDGNRGPETTHVTISALRRTIDHQHLWGAASAQTYGAAPLLLPISHWPQLHTRKRAASGGRTACSHSANTGFFCSPVRCRVQMRTQKTKHTHSNVRTALVDTYRESSGYPRSRSEASRTQSFLQHLRLWRPRTLPVR